VNKVRLTFLLNILVPLGRSKDASYQVRAGDRNKGKTLKGLLANSCFQTSAIKELNDLELANSLCRINRLLRMLDHTHSAELTS
jgi:hypothetical protein